MLANEENDEDPLIHVLEIAGNAIVGGMEKYVYNLAQHLPGKGFNITCLAPYESAFTSSLRHLGSNVFVTHMDANPPWRSIQFATELIRHQRIDLIHTHLPRAHVLGGLAGRLTNIPVVATIHGMDITAQDLGISRTTGTHLTVVCHDAYAQALALGMPPERLTMIPNGVDTKLFSPNRTGLSFRKALHISPTVPLVGFVGRLSWEKGPDLFLELARRVHQSQPDVQFVLVGDGPMEGELMSMILSAEMADYVHLAGLWSNTWEVYPAFDIQAITSRIEGMPFALLEGMACGRPVAAMSVGGVGELVEVNTTGLTSAEKDWGGLAEAVLKMLANPELTKQMGQAGRKRVEEYFDLQHSIQLMASLFRRQTGRCKKDEKLAAGNVLQPTWPVLKSEQEVLPVQANHMFLKNRST